MDCVEQLKNIRKQHEFFIGIDSDGCVFDTMEIKHKECFCPCFIKHFRLQSVSRYARDVWEFVNLYSRSRAINRFPALQECLERLRNHPVICVRGIRVDPIPALERWLKQEKTLGNPTLERRIRETQDPDLIRIYDWSMEVNERIREMVFGIPPFPGVKQVLETAGAYADMMVVSQTPVDALAREWKENRMEHYVRMIAGQEHGTKTEHLKIAAGEKYRPENTLMIGDAFGDLHAAESNRALFFPVLPGKEECSWKQLKEEGISRFFEGTFAGEYQRRLITEFEQALPGSPLWEEATA